MMSAPMTTGRDERTPPAALRLRGILLPLLPALTLAVLWARSAYVGDVWSGARRFSEWRIRSDWGRLSLTVISGTGVDAQPTMWETVSGGGTHGEWPGAPARRHDMGVATFRAGGVFLSVADTYWAVEVYHPVLIAVLALPVVGRVVVLSARRRRIRHRIDAGLCVRCGYDVRGTPGRCPECGVTF